MERLKINIEGYTLYRAGLPRFQSNFTRDAIIAGILFRDPEMLGEQLAFCAKKQGRRKNPYTGEEPGKIFHEFPPLSIGKNSTLYNACDTTALFLIGFEVYQKLTGDYKLAHKHKAHLEKAVDYILRHLKQGVFIEDPAYSNARQYLLKVTYWKDSTLAERSLGKPYYPVVYPLAHIQNMRGLRSAAYLLASENLSPKIKAMQAALSNLFDEDRGVFYIALDNHGPVRGISSDNLQALFYLQPGKLSSEKLAKILSAISALETPIGYRTLDEETARPCQRAYHTCSVWPFEQALIHIATHKHQQWAEHNNLPFLNKQLKHTESVCRRIANKLDTAPEFFILEKEGARKAGADPQLWTIAAKHYFANPYSEFLV